MTLKDLFGSSANEKKGIEGAFFKYGIEGLVFEFLEVVKKMSPEDREILRDFVDDVFGGVVDKLKK